MKSLTMIRLWDLDMDVSAKIYPLCDGDVEFVRSGLSGADDAKVKISLYDGETGHPLRSYDDVNSLLSKGTRFGFNNFNITCDIFVEGDCKLKGWLAKYHKIGGVKMSTFKAGSRSKKQLENKLWGFGVHTHKREDLVSEQHTYYTSGHPAPGWNTYFKHEHIFDDLYYCQVMTMHEEGRSWTEMRLSIGAWNE